MKDFANDITLVVLAILFFVGLFVGVGLTRYYWIASNPVTVLVDDYEVYSGPRACLELESTGLATKVEIKKPPLCFRTIATYSTSSVIVKPDIDQMILNQEPRRDRNH